MATGMIEFLTANAPLLRNVSVLALLGYSVHLALRAGVFSFATIGFFAIGGYVSANLLQAGWAWPLVLGLVVVVGLGVAFLVSPVLTRLRHLYLAMATLAFTLFIQSLALSWGTYTGGAQGLFGIPRVLPLGFMLAIVVAVIVLTWATSRGRLGRATATVRHDELLSASVGVNTNGSQAGAFAASAAVGAAAGFVQVSTTGVFGPENVNFGMVVQALIVLVVGGALYWAGPLVGAVIVGALPLYLANAGNWSLILQAVVVLLIVVYQPDGVIGIVKRLVQWSTRLWRSRSDREAPGLEAVKVVEQ